MAWRLAMMAALYAAGLAVLLGRGSQAEPPPLRIVFALDLPTLPLVVAKHDHLIEKQVEARNLAAVTVQWLTPNGGNPLEQLTNGQADVVAVLDLADFVELWDERSGTPQEIRGLTALAQMPYLLLSRNPAVATLRDIGPKDRIAVPAVKTSMPAVMLQMAAAQEWGIGQYARLDPQTVARADDTADDAMQAGNGDIDLHFVRLPFADDERANSAIHRVMDSFDVAGPHSVAALVTTARFRDNNPALCSAIAAAVAEADDYISHNRGAVAEIFNDADKTLEIPVEVLSDMLSDPDLAYKPSPVGLLHLVAFLHQTGRVKHNPDTWEQLFFPEIYKLGGS